MKAILLCAGYATRLRPLTDHCPKHLLEVCGKSILSHVVDKIAALPLTGVYVVTNNKFYQNFLKWKEEDYALSIPLSVINDGTLSNEDRLGSIGDVNFVIQQEGIRDDLILVNADNLFTFDLKGLHAAFQEKKNVIACFDVKDEKEAAKMGIPTIDETGRVIDFVEKPENPSSTEVSIGIYLYEQQAASRIKEYVDELAAKGVRPDTTGDFVAWLAAREDTYTYSFSAETDHWVDIGTPEQYENARNSDLFRS
jgi:glucose-1-phosphate thymidylyltransferase